MSMSEFQDSLGRLGLGLYYEGFMQEAFDSWEVLVDITESDLDALGVKLGHRRVLQRAISDHKRSSVRTFNLAVSNSDSKDSSTAQADGTSPPGNKGLGHAGASNTAGNGTKRKYRRHPKPDENAPERPPSAYVLFSNKTREELKGQELSFTEIAKTVGERWQVLVPEEKGVFESKSQALKDKYYQLLSEYKKTQEYADYQKYLVQFKAKHDKPAADPEGKRPRKDCKENAMSRSNSNDPTDSDMENNIRPSSTKSCEWHHTERRASSTSPPAALTRSATEWQTPTSALDGISPYKNGGTVAWPGHQTPERKMQPIHTFASVNNGPMQLTFLSAPYRMADKSGPPTTLEPQMSAPPTTLYGTQPNYPSRSGISSGETDRRRRSRTIMLPPLLHSDSSLSDGVEYGHKSLKLDGHSGPRLPPLCPSRSMHDRPSLPPPLMSPISTYSPKSGLATLLQAGEHLALQSAQHSPDWTNGRFVGGHVLHADPS